MLRVCGISGTSKIRAGTCLGEASARITLLIFSLSSFVSLWSWDSLTTTMSWSPAAQLTHSIDNRLPVLIVHVDLHPQPRCLQLASKDGENWHSAREATVDVCTSADRVKMQVRFDRLVDPLKPFHGER